MVDHIIIQGSQSCFRMHLVIQLSVSLSFHFAGKKIYLASFSCLKGSNRGNYNYGMDPTWVLWGKVFTKTFLSLHEAKDLISFPGFYRTTGGPKGRQAEPHTHMGNRNPWVDFLMVIMASGIARGRVRTTATTTTTESRNMAAILQIMGWQRLPALVYCVLLWYWTSMWWSVDTCQNKVSADQYHVTSITWPVSRDYIAGSRLQLVEVECFFKLTADQVLVFDWIAGSCLVNLLKTVQDCSETG